MKKSGFTFMELLIAFTIFSIIAASVYYTLGSGIRVYRRGNTMIRDNQRLRLFFNTVSRDMRNAVPYNTESGSESESGFRLEPEWLADRVSFPALINVFGEEKMYAELARVSYYTDSEGRGGKKLMRKRAGKEEGFDEEFAEEEELLEGLEDFTLEDFSLEYCYEVTGFEGEFDWRDEEFEDALPMGVKIILTLKNRVSKAEEVFSEKVFIPMGTLGKDTE